MGQPCIIIVGLVSFIDKSDHRFMWCGASVTSVAAVLLNSALENMLFIAEV